MNGVRRAWDSKVFGSGTSQRREGLQNTPIWGEGSVPESPKHVEQSTTFHFARRARPPAASHFPFSRTGLFRFVIIEAESDYFSLLLESCPPFCVLLSKLFLSQMQELKNGHMIFPPLIECPFFVCRDSIHLGSF